MAERNYNMSNMQENEQVKTTQEQLIEQAVEAAHALPVPEKTEDRLPYWCESKPQTRGFKTPFSTRTKKAEFTLVAKLDAEGKELVHGNNGQVLIKVPVKTEE